MVKLHWVGQFIEYVFSWTQVYKRGTLLDMVLIIPSYEDLKVHERTHIKDPSTVTTETTVLHPIKL